MSKTQIKAGSLNRPAAMSEDEKEMQMKRMLMAKREAVAQMCLSSLCQNPSAVIDVPLVEKAFSMAEEFCKRAYGYRFDIVKDIEGGDAE